MHIKSVGTSCTLHIENVEIINTFIFLIRYLFQSNHKHATHRMLTVM